MFRFSVVSNQISFIQKLFGSMNNLMNCTFLYLRVHDHDAWNNVARLLILQNELLILRYLFFDYSLGLDGIYISSQTSIFRAQLTLLCK